MVTTRTTRRGVIALGAVALAGCTSSGGNGDDEPTDDDPGNEDEPSETDELNRNLPERDIEPAWDEAAPFRPWLLDSTHNRRFDYTAVFPEEADPAAQLPDFFDVATDDLDGHLIQTESQVFLGSFDVESIANGAEASDEYEFSGHYEGYAVVEPTGSEASVPHEIAVGSEAIVLGADYEARIDARLGEHERLEEVDSEFTHLFRELPYETTVTAQYDSPMGGSMEDVYIWGVASESPTAETMTWVFVLREDPSEDVLEELESVSDDVEESELDGRTATVVGAPPEMPAYDE
ncbi:hypothetical protein ACLI4Z_07105 [Natrialbaceae archaeon A-arb3/5]